MARVSRIETVVVGAGQAGLALGWHLTRRGQEHLLLERGRIGERWRSERWDSLALLSPNAHNLLPGQETDDPDGFMPVTEFAASLRRYADGFGAPVWEGVDVESAERRADGRFRIRTSAGTLTARNLVVATGTCVALRIPGVASRFPAAVCQVPVTGYRRPALLPPGGVLVVGAGPSGQQVAREIRASGRDVVLAVGSHARAPRRYRGRDLWDWLDAMGSFETTLEELSDPKAALAAPSLTVTGANGGVDIDLGLLQEEGVTIAGRLLGVDGTAVRFADDLDTSIAAAEERLRRLLASIDAHVERHGGAATAADPIAPVEIRHAPTEIDLAKRGIGSVIWATGYRREYPWLHVPAAIAADGEIVQHHGVTPVNGLYTLGIRFQRRRRSHFIGGVGEDAGLLAERIADAQRREIAVSELEPRRRRRPLLQAALGI